ncbi:putative GGC1-protein of the mitochondrial carrier family [Obelidium mucronatum]|nr:putative GGC1-protein of the mitochondrial carrier family [Obelidium mucronatum]
MKEHSSSKTTGIFGAGFAGFLELFLFHPVDTVAKRLINDRSRTRTLGNIRQIVFKEAAGRGIVKEIASLYPAFGWAVGYKIMQRSLQFGMHPIINTHLRAQYEPRVRDQVGSKWARTVIAATGGVLIGCTEVLLLPLDALKVKGQTGVGLFKTESKFISLNTPSNNNSTKSSTTTSKGSLIQNPRLLLNLYRGWSWTAARNSFGCIALFGTSTYIKDNVFHLYDPSAPAATLSQHFAASLSGAVASIVIAAPIDVIKVRMQATSLNEASLSGWVVLKDLIRNEGPSALVKGVVPKVIAAAPKVTFSFTIAQWLADIINKNV